MRPRLLRPPDFRSGAVSDGSGFAFVISVKSNPVWKRLPADVGRYWMVGIGLGSLEEVDPAALGEGHVRLLPVRPPALVTPDPAHLAEEAAGSDLLHLHLEEGLDGAADLHLVGARVHAEDDLVPALVHQRALLGDHGPLHDVARIHPWSPNRSAIRSRAARVSTRCSCPNTS